MWKIRHKKSLADLDGILKETGLSQTNWRTEIEDLKESYRAVYIPKGSSGYRTLTVPGPLLMGKQRSLLRLLNQTLKAPNFVTGGVQGGSIRSHARPHLSQLWVATFDVCNFFRQIRPAMIERVLLSLGFSDPVIEAIIRLSFVKDILPQGAATSPFLANIAFLPVDRVLRRIAKKRELTYTRYLDDLAFSGMTDLPQLRGPIRHECSRFGFPLHEEKERFMKAGTRQVITGLVVNKKLRPTPEFFRRLQEDMKNCQEAEGITVTPVLAGRLAFLKQFEPKLAMQIREEFQTSLP